MKDVAELLGQFKSATAVLDENRIDYVVFGGIAVWAYGRRRQTRDIDLLISRESAKEALAVLSRAGFSTEETDHRWLYKASLDGAHIDLIFKAKGEIRLTPDLLKRRRTADIDGYTFSIMDPENLVLLKILATKEIRPADWYDALSILNALGDRFDWQYFLEKAAPHADKVLSFLFLVNSFDAELVNGPLVPPSAVDRLIDIYHQDQSSSKSA